MNASRMRIVTLRVAPLLFVALIFSQLSTVARGDDTKDVTPPTVMMEYGPGGLVNGAISGHIPLKKAFSIKYSVEDDSELAKVTFSLFSDGALIRSTSSPSNVEATGKYLYWAMDPVIAKNAETAGPYYVCLAAEDPSGNRTLNFPRTLCKWLAIEVSIGVISNGCGGMNLGETAGEVQNYLLNEQKYGKVVVDFRDACNAHDAGYSGVTVTNPVLKTIVDYRVWTRKEVDEQFLGDLQLLCYDAFKKAKANFATISDCTAGPSLTKYTALLSIALAKRAKAKLTFKKNAPFVAPTPGAQTYYSAVRNRAKDAYDTNITIPGVQNENKPATYPAEGGRDNS